MPCKDDEKQVIKTLHLTKNGVNYQISFFKLHFQIIRKRNMKVATLDNQTLVDAGSGQRLVNIMEGKIKWGRGSAISEM